MQSSKWASLVAVVAGLTWVASAVLGWGDEPEQFSYLAGLALMLLALAFGGYALVSTAPVWLRAVVAIATPALGYMIWLSVEALGTTYVLVVLAGVVLIVAGAIGLGRTAGAAPASGGDPEPPVRGRRAAR
jgi:hypothetical protein